MDLQNKVEFPSRIYRHEILKKKLAVATNCELTEQEIKLFNAAVHAVSLQLIKENIKNEDLDGLIVFFTLNGDLILYEDYPTGCGVHFAMSVYFMERIRNHNSNIFTVFTFIEEMAHHYWRISNETLVKQKVEEIMKHIYPDFNLDYMRERWSLNGL